MVTVDREVVRLVLLHFIVREGVITRIREQLELVQLSADFTHAPYVVHNETVVEFLAQLRVYVHCPCPHYQGCLALDQGVVLYRARLLVINY